VKKRTIIGLAAIIAAVATMLAAPSVASATNKPEYTTVLWLIPDASKDPNAQDQPFIAQYPGADIAAMVKFMECGKRYQVDVYRPLPDGTKPDVLWADGFLRPNHDGGFLAYELPYTPYAVVTTDECPVVVPDPTVGTPAPVPPVTTPEVPSSPDTPAPTPPVTPPTAPASPTDTPPNLTPETGTPSLSPSVAPSLRIAPVPTPIRTEAKFTG